MSATSKTNTKTKTHTKTNTKTKTMTKPKCIKDPSHAIFSKSREFKDIKYDTYSNHHKVKGVPNRIEKNLFKSSIIWIK